LAPASSVRGSRGLTTRRSVTRAMGRQMAGRCPLQRGHLLGRQRQRGAESLGSYGSRGCCYRPNQRSEHRYQGSRPGAGQRMPGPRPPGSWRSSVGRYGRSEVNAKRALKPWKEQPQQERMRIGNPLHCPEQLLLLRYPLPVGLRHIFELPAGPRARREAQQGPFLPLFTRVRGIRILRSSLAESWIKPRNTLPRWP
jgi:hypothetical protein